MQESAGDVCGSRIYISWYGKIYQVQGSAPAGAHGIRDVLALQNGMRGRRRADHDISHAETFLHIFPEGNFCMVTVGHVLCPLKLAVGYYGCLEPMIVKATCN